MAPIVSYRDSVSRTVNWKHELVKIDERHFVYIATERLTKENAVEVLRSWMVRPLRLKVGAMTKEDNNGTAAAAAEVNQHDFRILGTRY